MIEITGKYNTAFVYQSQIDEATRNQLQTLVDQPFVENEKIRVQADTHAGAGCVIGFTQTIRDGKVCPNLVGVDIGCGMYVLTLEGIKKKNIDFNALDNYIRTHIPFGRNIHEGAVARMKEITELKCFRELKDTIKFERALGTLGGGNHFLEIDEDYEGNLYFIIHTGSRNMGKQVAEYYQDLADGICNRGLDAYFIEKTDLINTYKAEGRKAEIQKALTNLKKKYQENINKVPKDLAYLEGSHLKDYLHDMKICQDYAKLNRETIAKLICKFFGLDYEKIEKFETVHNYIDLDQMILRKGAIDCSEKKKVLIPINMRDGSIIAIGKGNPDYNYSGPHGAGRLMSRNEARATIKIEDFEKSMNGIFTTCVSEKTIDESAFAYKALEDILPWIHETCRVEKIITPIYNFKAEE